MGGDALWFTVDISEEAMARLSRKGPLKRLVERIFPPFSGELPVKGLKLEQGFREYLRKRLPEPWPASKHVLDYLTGTVTLYLRKGDMQMDGMDGWYLQLTFSGCAGLAEISASVAAHWGEIWLAEERGKIQQDILTPFGLTLTENDLPSEENIFLPLPRGGYAKYYPDHDPNEDFPSLCAADASLETDKTILGLLREMEKTHAEPLSRGVCQCQLCVEARANSAPGETPIKLFLAYRRKSSTRGQHIDVDLSNGRQIEKHRENLIDRAFYFDRIISAGEFTDKLGYSVFLDFLIGYTVLLAMDRFDIRKSLSMEDTEGYTCDEYQVEDDKIKIRLWLKLSHEPDHEIEVDRKTFIGSLRWQLHALYSALEKHKLPGTNYPFGELQEFHDRYESFLRLERGETGFDQFIEECRQKDGLLASISNLSSLLKE